MQYKKPRFGCAVSAIKMGPLFYRSKLIRNMNTNAVYLDAAFS